MTGHGNGAATDHVRCSRCGRRCSNDVPAGLVVRAFVECPECVAAVPERPRDVVPVPADAPEPVSLLAQATSALHVALWYAEGGASDTRDDELEGCRVALAAAVAHFYPTDSTEETPTNG